MPIFAAVIQAVWAEGWAKTALAPPSSEAKRKLSCTAIDVESGEVARGARFTECLRVDAKGKIIDAQYRLLSREAASARRNGREAGGTARRRVPTLGKTPSTVMDGNGRAHGSTEEGNSIENSGAIGAIPGGAGASRFGRWIFRDGK